MGVRGVFPIFPGVRELDFLDVYEVETK